MSKLKIEELRALSRKNQDPRFIPPPILHDLSQRTAEREQRLRVCNAEITHIQCFLHTFSVQRVFLQMQLDLLVSLPAPIRSLPVGLLQDILVETGASPFLLSQVCSHWRRVVFDSPVLWSKLKLDKGMWHRANNRLMMDEVLSRTRSHPLDVSITSRHSREAPESPWHLLTPHSGRWRSLDLIIPYLEGSEVIRELSQSRLSGLHTLSLTVSSSSGNRWGVTEWGNDDGWASPAGGWGNPWSAWGGSLITEAPSMPHFTQTPNLTSVTLTSIHPSTLKLPWEQLSTLGLVSVEFSKNDIRILSQCHRLQTLQLNKCAIEVSSPPEPLRIDWVLPIATLNIDPVSVRALLPDLHFPHLSSLQIEKSKPVPPSEHSAWTTSVSDVLIENDIQMLILIPYGTKIKSLCVDLSYLGLFLSVLEGSAAQPQPDLLLPHLEHLSLELDSQTADRAIQRLYPIVHAHSKAGFKELKLHLWESHPGSWHSPENIPLPLDVTLLRSLVSTGVRVRLAHETLIPNYRWGSLPSGESCGIWHVLEGEESEGIGDDHGIECPFFASSDVGEEDSSHYPRRDERDERRPMRRDWR